MAGELVLLSAGRSSSGIFRAYPFSETGTFAVQELRKYIRRASAVSLPVIPKSKRASFKGRGRVILTTAGHSENEALVADRAGLDFCARLREARAESFGIRRRGDAVLIVGKDEKGLLNGVYAFLERALGIRWLDPDHGGEHVPKAKRMSLGDVELVEQPQFPFRAVFCSGLDVMDWAAKNRMNACALGIQSWEAKRKRFCPEMRKRGMRLWTGGHGACYFLMPDKYLKRHPEYFALVNGTRRPPEPKPLNASKICYASKGALEVYTGNVLAYLASRPEVSTLALWPTDGGGFCECDACRKQDLGKQILKFASSVAREVAQHYPEVRIEHLSYGRRTIVPPRGVAPPENLSVAYCPYWDRSRAHPLVDARHGHPAYLFDKQGHHRAVCRNVETWSRIAHHLTIFSYYSDQVIKKSIYVPIPDVTKKDLLYYRALGVEGFLDCTCFRDIWWMDSLNLYVLAKMMWNPDDDVDAAVDAFYQAYFGRAAAAAAAFGRQMKDIMTTPLYHGFLVRDLMICGSDALCVAPFKPELDELSREEIGEKLDAAQANLGKAFVAAGEKDRLRKRRLQRLRLALDFFRLRFRINYHQLKTDHCLCMLETCRPRERKAVREDALSALARMSDLLREEKRFLTRLSNRDRTDINAGPQLKRWRQRAERHKQKLADMQSRR